MKKASPAAMHKLRIRSHLFYNLMIFAIGLIVFIGIPPFILEPPQAKQIFNNGMTAQVIAGIVLFMSILCLSIAAIYWLLVLLRLKIIAVALVTFLFSWVALSAFLLPLTTGNGLLPFLDSPTHWTNFYLVFGLAALLTLAWVSVHSNAVLAAMTAFILIAVVPTIPNMFSEFESPKSPSGIHLSENKNIILVSFDGLPGHTIKDILEGDQTLREPFKDFTFYENVAASAPGTDISQMGIIHGNNDFTNWNNDRQVKWENLYFNDTAKYDFYTLYSFNEYNQKGTRFSGSHLGPSFQFAELDHFYNAVFLRIGTKHGVAMFNKLKGVFLPRDNVRYTHSVDNFDRLTNMMTIGNDRIGVVYLHFGATHFPIRIDENCVDRSSDNEWIEAHSNEPGIINSSLCAMNKYVELLDRLKAINAYDNSLILLISDHGKPSMYYESQPYNLRINGSRIYGFDRYLPMMMIKDIGANQEEIQYDQSHVILDDIAQTTCYAVGGGENCEITTGVNLLDENDEPPLDYLLHVPKNKGSSHRIETLKPVRLSREMPLLDAMRASEEIELTE
jgi:hypothetical protein